MLNNIINKLKNISKLYISTLLPALIICLYPGIHVSVTGLDAAIAGNLPEILNKPLIEIQLPDLPENDGSGGLIAYDLDGDGTKDFIVTGPGKIIAAKTDGTILWAHDVDIQVTRQSEKNGLPGSHAPGVQTGDVMNNGAVEVLFLTRSGKLHILRGVDGKKLHRIPIKAPGEAERWEHLVIGNFRGKGDFDILLQATNAEGYRMGRFVAAYAIKDLVNNDTPVPLWRRDDFHAAAHNGARIADLNGDGKDEIIGASILSPEGEKVYEVPVRGHLDGIYIANVQPDRPGLEVIALEEGGPYRLLGLDNALANWVNRRYADLGGAGNRTFVYDMDGLIWASHHKQIEPQNAAVGKFKPDTDEVQIWLRSRFNLDQKPYLFDANGMLITSYELMDLAPSDWTRSGLEVIVPIHWSGTGQQFIAAKARHESGDVAIVDAITGEFKVRIPESADRLYVADVLNDWREEIIVLSGNMLRVYGNPAKNPNPDQPSLWLQQHYQRVKQTWNYYSP